MINYSGALETHPNRRLFMSKKQEKEKKKLTIKEKQERKKEKIKHKVESKEDE